MWRWICLAPCKPFNPSPYPAVKIVLINAVRADEGEGLGGWLTWWAEWPRQTRESVWTSDSGRTRWLGRTTRLGQTCWRDNRRALGGRWGKWGGQGRRWGGRGGMAGLGVAGWGVAGADGRRLRQTGRLDYGEQTARRTTAHRWSGRAGRTVRLRRTREGGCVGWEMDPTCPNSGNVITS